MAAYRQPPNLRRLLCKSKLSAVERSSRLQRAAHRDAPGWKRCGTSCPICPYSLPSTKQVKALNSNYIHDISTPVTCTTEFCTYYWKCTKVNCSEFPACEYVGMTTRSFKARFSEHRDYVKRNILTEPSGEHFNKPGHNVSHLKGLVLETVQSQDPFLLKARESLLSRNLTVIAPLV